MIHKFSVETIEKKRTFTEDLKFSFNLLFTTYMNECTISKSILNPEKKIDIKSLFINQWKNILITSSICFVFYCLFVLFFGYLLFCWFFVLFFAIIMHMFAVCDDNYPRDSNNVMRQSCETTAFPGGGGGFASYVSNWTDRITPDKL